MAVRYRSLHDGTMMRSTPNWPGWREPDRRAPFKIPPALKHSPTRARVEPSRNGSKPEFAATGKARLWITATE
jgi:hypothetical protein